VSSWQGPQINPNRSFQQNSSVGYLFPQSGHFLVIFIRLGRVFSYGLSQRKKVNGRACHQQKANYTKKIKIHV